MSPEQIDKLATAMSKHLPCTVASIADALRKADAELSEPEATETA